MQGKYLAVGHHPFQLYSQDTANGAKVTIMLKELLFLGHSGAQYDAWLIKTGDGGQFGNGFFPIDPNSKIPTLMDCSGPTPILIFESGSILIYLAEKFDALLPTEAVARARTLSWLFWHMGSARYLELGLDQISAPTRSPYALDRFGTETKRQLDVLDRRLGKSKHLGGGEYTIADIAVWPWYAGLVEGRPYGSTEFLKVQKYKNVVRWADLIGKRPAVKRGRMVKWATGEPSNQLHERIDASDFSTAQDKLTAKE
jgi:GSH-dependent disulfide-bond oxidoreductase